MSKVYNRDVRIAKWSSLYVADVQIVDGNWAVIAATVPVTTTDLTTTGDTILGNNSAVDTVTVNAATSLAGATTVATNNKILFRDSAIYINSANDGYMDIAADTAVRVASPLMTFATTTGVQFRDSAITIASADDWHLDITADVSVDLNTALLNVWWPVVFTGTPQTLTWAGAVNLTTFSTLVVTTGADALTLAAWAEWQFKFIRMKTDGGDGTLTVTNLQWGTTITFNDAWDFVLLFYQDTKRHVIANSGCTVA